MHLESEWWLFLYTYIASALTALSPVLLSSKPLSFRLLLGTVVLYGGLGSGFGMTIGYDYLGGKTHPLRVILYGMLVGAGAIKKKDVTNGLRTFMTSTLRNTLGILEGSKEKEDDPKPKRRHNAHDSAETPDNNSEQGNSHD